MKIQSWTLGLMVLVFIFGGIATSAVLGYWQTTSTKVPVTYQSGEFAGEYNPSDIRGSYSFGEISTLFKIPLTDLSEAFNLDPKVNAAAFLCKDLEAMYAGTAQIGEIGTDSVRVFVALYRSMPYTLSSSTYLPESAVIVLKTKVKLNAEQEAFLDSHKIAIGSATQTPPATTTTATSAEQPASSGAITGKTTFRDLQNLGVSLADIEAVIGEKVAAPTITIRDYATQKGVEFSTLKTALQAKVDAIKK